ncbi:MAG: regulatory protein RecX [Chloroflexi bacterium]|nr:regulatory protein RecX [Chloroflexota bacterium]
MGPPPEAERAWQAALRLLAYRPRSREEMRLRLGRRFSPEAVQGALERLRQRGYLDDVSFARFWRQSREAHRPRSAALIRRELRDRGVAQEVAESVVAGLDDEGSAYRAGRQRVPVLQDADEARFRRRLAGYLRRRGFGLGLTLRTVERLWREHERS